MIAAIVILLIVGFGLLGILLKLLKKPIKWAFKLLLHALFGFIFLFVFNFVGAWLGLSLELNWLNAIVTGVFGIPGVVVLLILKYLL
ncbi:MAG: pro-sigmaK processing inhibitor BofA [Ruminococcaceae bacterium]|nr:pro-sigmaK processing inhibitor BofA [Oscillospiraceae bacterium]